LDLHLIPYFFYYMKIFRLIDDYDDELLRNYWKNNLKYLLTNDVKKTVRPESLLFSNFSMIVVHPDDYLNIHMNVISTEKDLVHTVNFMNKSSQEIFELINNKITSSLVHLYKRSINNLSIRSLFLERIELYPSHQRELVLSNINDNLFPLDDIFKTLVYPSKDLLFLLMVHSYLWYDYSNSELMIEINNSRNTFIKAMNETFNQIS
jgi:hypothetical protein